VAAQLITKIMKPPLRFHGGDIFTNDPDQFSHLFLYGCRNAEEATPSLLIDVFQRQSGNMPNRCTMQELESMSTLDIESKVVYLKQVQPLHFLPRCLFGDTLPADIRQTINKFLVIPEAFLVFHHCSPSGVAGAGGGESKTSSTNKVLSSSSSSSVSSSAIWRRKAIHQCLMGLTPENRLLRIITIASSKDLPAPYFMEADYVFVFTKNRMDLSDLYKKADMKTVIESPHCLQELLTRLKDFEGIVLMRKREIYHELAQQIGLAPAERKKIKFNRVAALYHTTSKVRATTTTTATATASNTSHHGFTTSPHTNAAAGDGSFCSTTSPADSTGGGF
jgi:hypothetical protein